MERSGQIYLLGTSDPLERLLQMLSLKPLFILVSDPIDLPAVVAEQEAATAPVEGRAPADGGGTE